MNIEELKAMIPSETVRNYVLETGWTFTDKEKAALLYHSDLPLEQQLFWLRGPWDKTEDEDLKNQITEYLSCKEQGLQVFKENGDKSHIYVLKTKYEDGEYYDEGYFFDWELAYERGKQEKRPFQIEKCVVCDVNEPSDDSSSSVADICFNNSGETTYFLSREVPFDEEQDNYFTYVFYEIPNPFEKGDIVRLVGTEEYGIVETTQKRWKEDLIKWKSPEWLQSRHYVGYSDVQIRVVFPGEDSYFCHDHINPVNLELYRPQKGETADWLDLLLLSASDLYKGEGIFDELYYYTENYRKSKKEK